MGVIDDVSSQQLYHGTKADLKPGDLIAPGYNSNYGSRKKAAYVYLTATLEAATWGAELAVGEGPERIYIVEPTGPFEDDPNLTDKKFPGNPTKSYRTRDPLRVTGEVKDWTGHSPEQLKAMNDHLERLKELGIEAIEDGPPAVLVNDEGVTLWLNGENDSSMLWTQLASVEIGIVSAPEMGYFEAFWSLTGEGAEVVVPVELIVNSKKLNDRLLKLPGFDMEMYRRAREAEAQGSMGEFICWRKSNA